MEFGSSNIPGVYDSDYTLPLLSSAKYFQNMNFQVIRFPFLWERLQPLLSTPVIFDPTYLQYMDEYVNSITDLGMSVILDVQNFARYRSQIIGASGSNVKIDDFAQFWGALSNHYKSNARVIFGLMNEPHDMPTELWVDAANAAIASIRDSGATNLITVPGNQWTGACFWMQSWYGTPNSKAMLNIVDSLHNFIIEVHLYFDSDHSGTSPECTSPTIGVECLTDLTNWLRTNKLAAYVGELAGGNNLQCEVTVTNTLKFIQKNSDVFWGWSWWAAGKQLSVPCWFEVK
jgi:endoglucanase